MPVVVWQGEGEREAKPPQISEPWKESIKQLVKLQMASLDLYS